jgi:hypothetical protein
MAEVSWNVQADVERVWAELADGWMFTGWVVGATHIRDVDGQWPSVGARIHHQVGAWPLVVSDTTLVLESEPPRRLILQARMWPIGEARVELGLSPEGDGTEVTMVEYPMKGPAKWLYNPLFDLLLRMRNRESLRRLAAIAENRPFPDFDERKQAGGGRSRLRPVQR